MGSIYNFLKVVGAWAVVYKGRNTSIRCPDLFIVFLKKAFLFCEIHFMVPRINIHSTIILFFKQIIPGYERSFLFRRINLYIFPVIQGRTIKSD